jgi:hypothetical protein
MRIISQKGQEREGRKEKEKRKKRTRKGEVSTSARLEASSVSQGSQLFLFCLSPPQ